MALFIRTLASANGTEGAKLCPCNHSNKQISMTKILITGSAGFIGYHLTGRLLAGGAEVVGIDNINSYYDPKIKFDRLKQHGIGEAAKEFHKELQSEDFPQYRFIRMDLSARDALDALFAHEQFDLVCHLAAQAGVRYSIENPHAYIESNIQGFLNIIECSRKHGVSHFVYASSSSVYGLNSTIPLSTHHSIAHPVSMYATTKKCNELMAHTYSHLYGLPTTGLRFFTVYGPWGRPDMALFLFTRAMLAGAPIDIYNQGEMLRDFTYVDDITDGIGRVLNLIPQSHAQWNSEAADPATSSAPYRIYNIGNAKPVKLLDFIDAIEEKLGIRAIRNYLPMQPGDVQRTFSDISDLARDTGYAPQTEVKEGISNFIDWYISYHKKTAL
jgi:UDP-glucuronate 4-epimerase